MEAELRRFVRARLRPAEPRLAAEDAVPEEILAHMPLLCEEKGIPYAYVPSKQELGVSVGLGKATASIAILDAGKAKPIVDDLGAKLRAMKK